MFQSIANKRLSQQLSLVPLSKIIICGLEGEEDRYSIERLAESIKKDGLCVPLTVCAKDEYYYLISGRRRFLAAKSIGMVFVPAVICKTDIKTAEIFTLSEQIHRKTLSPFFEAEQISRIMREYSLSETEIAERLCISENTLSDKLSLLAFSYEERQKIRLSNLSDRHIKLLLNLSGEKRTEILNTVIAEELSASKTQELLSGKEKLPPVRVGGMSDTRFFANSLNKLLDVMKKSGFVVKTKKNENDTFLEYNIRINKPSKQMSLFY